MVLQENKGTGKHRAVKQKEPSKVFRSFFFWKGETANGQINFKQEVALVLFLNEQCPWEE